MSILSAQPPSVIVRAILGACNLGQDTGDLGLVTMPAQNADWPVYIANMPDGADVRNNIVALYDQENPKQGRLMRGEVIERQAVQVLVRSQHYPVGSAHMRAITRALDDVRRLGIDTGTHLFFVPNIARGGVLPLGQDKESEKRRYMFSLNVTFICRQEGPYTEWTDGMFSEYNFANLVHADPSIWFPG